ncbi:MAG: hypothetical protein QXS21_05730 [Thermoproteota archaeon]|nr:hypothetical protein [Candidatus Brockarchaeota archaeon]
MSSQLKVLGFFDYVEEHGAASPNPQKRFLTSETIHSLYHNQKYPLKIYFIKNTKL